MYQIVKAPNEILRTPTQKVDFAGARLTKIISEMTDTLIGQKDPEGVGLAANQVGLPFQIFLARFEVKKDTPIHVFVNPEMIEHSDEKQPTKKEEKKSPLEGCLSVPKYYGVVKRWQWVKLRFQKLSDDGEKLIETEEKFENFAAVVVQHELDHLNGKIFVERLLEQNGKLYKTLGKNRAGKEKWEEVELI